LKFGPGRGKTCVDGRGRAATTKMRHAFQLTLGFAVRYVSVMATAFLDRGRLRETLKRHPWVYPEAVKKIEGGYENGDVVRGAGPDGRFVAHAFVNDRSRLMLRLVSFEEKEEVGAAFVRSRVRAAAELREKTLELPKRANAYRVVHSEADGLPGLIV